MSPLFSTMHKADDGVESSGTSVGAVSQQQNADSPENRQLMHFSFHAGYARILDLYHIEP